MTHTHRWTSEQSRTLKSVKVKFGQQPAQTAIGMTRRRFMGRSLSLAAMATVPIRAAEVTGSGGPTFRAAIIGHTGHGNYGHEQDLIFNGRENIAVVAVADPDSAGLAQAAARSHAPMKISCLKKKEPAQTFHSDP